MGAGVEIPHKFPAVSFVDFPSAVTGGATNFEDNAINRCSFVGCQLSECQDVKMSKSGKSPILSSLQYYADYQTYKLCYSYI